jgi:hypothetical protein
VSNWRLTLVQLLPAIWVWAATADLRAHLLQGHSFNVLRGPVLVPFIVAIVAIAVASFFLNAVSHRSACSLRATLSPHEQSGNLTDPNRISYREDDAGAHSASDDADHVTSDGCIGGFNGE